MTDTTPPRSLEADVFGSILAEYNAGRNLEPADIEQRVQKLTGDLKNQAPTSAVLCELELLKLRNSTNDDLLQAIPGLRRQWAILSSEPRISAALDRSHQPKLLAEASFLTVQIMRHRALRETFEKIKASTLRRALALLVLAFPIALLIHAFLRRDPTVIIVMLVGACGGFVSFCQRVYKMAPGSDLLDASQELRSDRSSIVVKPILGGAFALALYLLFISRMVNGTLFPSLQIVTATDTIHFNDFFAGTIQASPGDFAKLLVWSFIAGFAERFVPDILDRLSKSSTGAKNASSH